MMQGPSRARPLLQVFSDESPAEATPVLWSPAAAAVPRKVSKLPRSTAVLGDRSNVSGHQNRPKPKGTGSTIPVVATAPLTSGGTTGAVNDSANDVAPAVGPRASVFFPVSRTALW